MAPQVASSLHGMLLAEEDEDARRYAQESREQVRLAYVHAAAANVVGRELRRGGSKQIGGSR